MKRRLSQMSDSIHVAKKQNTSNEGNEGPVEEPVIQQEMNAEEFQPLVDLPNVSTLGEIQVENILNSKEGHFIFMKAMIQGEHAIVKLSNAMPQTADILERLEEVQLTSKGANKAWCGYEGTMPGPSCTVDIFCPAAEEGMTEEKIEKLIEKQERKLARKHFVFVRETPEFYENVTLPYIDSIPASDVQWVRNIMNNIQPEVASVYDISEDRMNEKVVYSDPNPESGFALLVDFKWKSHPKKMADLAENPVREPTSVYCIAFPVRDDIRSLRDLNESHLPLLINLQENATQWMSDIYNLPQNKLRMFIHYQPQYYYFHVHVTSMDIDFGIENTRSKLLEEVISNIQLVPDYYQRSTLVYHISANHHCASQLK